MSAFINYFVEKYVKVIEELQDSYNDVDEIDWYSEGAYEQLKSIVNPNFEFKPTKNKKIVIEFTDLKPSIIQLIVKKFLTF